ncbi:Apurinic-apyrimidinic endonuclease [Halotydeus destructor]|nr:Apurinic-apyrimidinic endonuclease [Halotydeus destructor]
MRAAFLLKPRVKISGYFLGSNCRFWYSMAPKRTKSASVASKAKQLKTDAVKVELKEELTEGARGDVDVKLSKAVTPKKSGKKTLDKLPNLLPGVDWYEKSETKMYVGAHVSIGGGLENAVFSAASQGCQAFGLFLCNQRTWKVADLEVEAAEKFIKACKDYGYPSNLIVPHASYLMNVGSSDPELRAKSQNSLTDGLSRCDRLGIDIYNFHPGSTCNKISREACIKNIADAVNVAHGKTKKAVAVLENMCKQGHTIGGDFKELKAIIDLVEDKSRIGVCLDTCHAFAAGYNLKTEDGYTKMMNDFDKIIGFKYLKAIHLNDSKGPCDSHLDRHENIGKGLIGMKFFERLMKEERFKNIPMILETPDAQPNIYRDEVAKLYKLI